MSGVTLKDLSSYHDGAMKWFKDGLVSEHNRLFAQTEEAGAVSFWPLGGTPLEGKVKFSFKETPPASGDKGPENPSAIAGVQEVKLFHSNSNMLRFPYYDSQRNYGSGALAMTANADGSVSVSGKYSGNGALRLFADYPGYLGLPVKDGLTYYNTSKGDAYQPQLRFYNMRTTNVAKFVSAGSSWLYNLGDSTTTIAIIYPANLDLTATTAIIFPSLSIVPYNGPWEQPETVVHNVDLGSTYYGGEIDLATGVMTVTHRSFTIDGTTAISTSGYGEGETSYRFGYYLPEKEQTIVQSYSTIPAGYACDKLPIVLNPAVDGSICYGLASSSVLCYLRLPKQLISAGDGLSLGESRPLAQAYLAQNPITVVYPIHKNNIYTVQLDPLQLTALTQKDKYTPRMNTVYTDADSIQIRYRKSLIHDEDEKVQAIVALGGNV